MHSRHIKKFLISTRSCILCCQVSTQQKLTPDVPDEQTVKMTAKEKDVLRLQPFIKDKHVAGVISDHLQRFSTTATIVEAFPGEGLLTEALLRKNRRVVVYEGRRAFQERMLELKEKFPENFNCIPENYHKAIAKDLAEEFLTEKFYANLPTTPWYSPDAVDIQYVSCLTMKSRMEFHVLCMAQTAGIFQCGKPDIYLITNARAHGILVDEPDCSVYTTPSVVFRLFFDVMELDEFPASALSAPERFTKRKTGDSKPSGYAYLVRLKVKDNTDGSILPYCDVPNFVSFVSWAFKFRAKPVIAQLEQWSPGIGFDIIRDLDFDVFKKFREVQPEEFLYIFKLLKSRSPGAILPDSDTYFSQ